MNIPFYKYHGAGNDFIIIDNRLGEIALTSEDIAWMCDRRFGIGADGLMYLADEEGFDFKMVYFNADGNESTMCGNGGRCITLFAKDLGVIETEAVFNAVDGKHTATVLADGNIALGMRDVIAITMGEAETILDTGSPHIVIPVQDLLHYDVDQQGKTIRNEPRFGPKGINVNFVEIIDQVLHIRTYERGVEGETLACGTGVTAAAISASSNATGSFSIPVIAQGGDMKVDFIKTVKDQAESIVLTGPAQFVFEGIMEV